MTTALDPVTRSEARTDLSPYALDLALRTGAFTEAFPGVLARGPAPVGPLATAAAALAWAGGDGVLCGPTAAWLWGCGTARSPDVHVLRPDGRNRRAPAGIVLHSGPLWTDDVRTVAGLPVLRHERVLADLLCGPDPPAGFVIADEAFALTPPAERPRFRAQVHAMLRTRRDRRGAVQAHRLVDLLVGATSAAASELLLALTEEGFPVPQHRFPVTDEHRRELYRLQFAWPRRRIAVELGDPAADPLRDVDLAGRGWRLVRARTVPAVLAALPAVYAGSPAVSAAVYDATTRYRAG